MRLGCDVISEKPMTTDAIKAQSILDTIEQTGRKLRVTFNYRYVPHATKVRELVRDGVIGRPTAVDFSWMLDTSHGADYFRRWHREKDKSGGLLIHKSTHHFDIINWWIGSYPKTVFALGDLQFYGRANAVQRGEAALAAYPRYTGHPSAETDPFYFPLDGDERLKGLYLNAEADSGYVRDRNVFGDGITSEDTMAVMARYNNGVILNYSLICYAPWEGWRAAITGDKGRIEITVRHDSQVLAGPPASSSNISAANAPGHEIIVHPIFGKPYEVDVETIDGPHGGGDRIMLEQIFSSHPPPDPFHRAASHIDGTASILLGICANESMRTGQSVTCDDMVALPTEKVVPEVAK
jgi:predicted dehydrogenase